MLHAQKASGNLLFSLNARLHGMMLQLCAKTAASPAICRQHKDHMVCSLHEEQNNTAAMY
jgi:hypothetical protein